MPTPRENYTNSVERQGFTGARLHGADFGGDIIAKAVQGFGQDLGRTADNIDKIQQHDAEVAAQEADNIRLARRMKRLYGDPESGTPGFFNQQGKNALTDGQTLSADLRKIDEDVAAELLRSKPRAKRMFDEITLKRDNDALPQISRHMAVEREKHADSVDADAFDLAIDNAATSEDPLQIDENIATAGNIAVRQAMRKGTLDDNGIAQARQSGIGKAVASVAKKLSIKSPAEAQAFVTVKAKDMDPDDAASLLEVLAGPAAKEHASETVGQYIVTNGQLSTPAPAQAAPSDPATPTVMPDEAALDAAQWAQESGGVHTLSNGQLIESPAGARGVSQVLRGTGVDPGYGVKPLQNQSRAEYIRFGKDYRKAMLREYNGNIVLALTAYNWGPGNLNDHIKKVGDPSKGQISDAAFLNSIPVKEAREYATKVLGRVGVNPSGASGGTQQTAAPVDNEEINLEQSLARVDAADITFREKEALKSEIKERYGLGRQAKIARTDDLKDQVAGWMNTLKDPDSFTSYDQLPLDLRQRISSDPTLEAGYRQMADVNKDRAQAKLDAEAAKRAEEAKQQSDFAMSAQAYNNPDAFKRLNLMDPSVAPGMSLSDRQKWMGVQNTMRKSEEGNTKYANFDAIRTTVRRFAGGKPPENIGLAFDEAARREQALLDRNGGKPISDAEREGIAREVMTKFTLVTAGAMYGENKKTIFGFEAPGAVRKAKDDKTFRRLEVDSFEVIKAQLQRLWRRTPTDDEVRSEIDKRTQNGGLRL